MQFFAETKRHTKLIFMTLPYIIGSYQMRREHCRQQTPGKQVRTPFWLEKNLRTVYKLAYIYQLLLTPTNYAYFIFRCFVVADCTTGINFLISIHSSIYETPFYFLRWKCINGRQQWHCRGCRHIQNNYICIYFIFTFRINCNIVLLLSLVSEGTFSSL